MLLCFWCPYSRMLECVFPPVSLTNKDFEQMTGNEIVWNLPFDNDLWMFLKLAFSSVTGCQPDRQTERGRSLHRFCSIGHLVEFPASGNVRLFSIERSQFFNFFHLSMLVCSHLEDVECFYELYSSTNSCYSQANLICFPILDMHCSDNGSMCLAL